MLLIDNCTAVAYINNLGGTVSPQATMLARELWMWCLERGILISAQYLPGEENTRADRIPSDERSLGLDAKPSAVPTDTASVSKCQR